MSNVVALKPKDVMFKCLIVKGKTLIPIICYVWGQEKIIPINTIIEINLDEMLAIHENVYTAIAYHEFEALHSN